MTREQLAEELGMKESYLQKHWAEIVRRFDKMGIQIVKINREPNARYGIKSYDDKEIRWEPRDDEWYFG